MNSLFHRLKTLEGWDRLLRGIWALEPWSYLPGLKISTLEHNKTHQGKTIQQVPAAETNANNNKTDGNITNSPDVELEKEVNETLQRERNKDTWSERENSDEEQLEHQNRFDALTNQEVAGDMNEVEDLNSQTDEIDGSEFVEATVEFDNTDIEAEHAVEVHSPGTVKRNTEFLKESWANMAENEEAEASLLRHLETEPDEAEPVVSEDNAPFTMVKSTNKARKQKSPQKSTQPTRSKVCIPKPYKWSAFIGILEV